MQNISLPKKFLAETIEKGKRAKVIIEPCFPGYGITLGNALRRVLLSSLSGGAVTAVKIKGVQHEFSAVKNIKEDVVDIILNLKKIRVKVYSDEPVVLKLKAKGDKVVTAGEIENSVDAEILNKDAIIATVTDADTTLEMDLTVAKGIGYSMIEDRPRSVDIGEILVDSIFTPVKSVGLSIEPTRVGQKTDFDRIVLDIETDGTMTPEEATQKAGEILVNQFSWIMEGGQKEISEVDIEAPVILPEGEKVEATETKEAEEAVEETEEEEKDAKPKKRGRPKKSETAE